MIGRSPEMEKLYRILSKVAQSVHPVLILGESGTGKELVARTIHAYGPNPRKAVSAGGLRLAGAHADRERIVRLRQGRVYRAPITPKTGCWSRPREERSSWTRSANCRSICRPSLLRALQEREVRPVGATHRVPIKARILTATNRDLAAMVENGAFRKDLFYRLNVVNLRLPPLRDRRGRHTAAGGAFLDRISREHRARFSISSTKPCAPWCSTTGRATCANSKTPWSMALTHALGRAIAAGRPTDPIAAAGTCRVATPRSGTPRNSRNRDPRRVIPLAVHERRGHSRRHSHHQRRQAAGGQAARDRQDHALSQAEGIRILRCTAARLTGGAALQCSLHPLHCA